MTSLLQTFVDVIRDTLRDVMPIVLTVLGFQLLVLRRSIPNLRRVAIGFVYVTFGMALFLLGLEQASRAFASCQRGSAVVYRERATCVAGNKQCARA